MSSRNLIATTGRLLWLVLLPSVCRPPRTSITPEQQTHAVTQMCTAEMKGSPRSSACVAARCRGCLLLNRLPQLARRKLSAAE